MPAPWRALIGEARVLQGRYCDLLWHHGFTYRFSDGVLCAIATTEHSPIVGRKKLRTYPVCEANGLVFVFVGDTDYPPPLVVHDVPTTFLDDDMVIRGKRRMVAANLRIGAENGFDSTHISSSTRIRC
jgi:carbazole 1,9a-dioxygenase terminal dioxygenase component